MFENKDESHRKTINYIITLGGDGTILWAHKQFHGHYIPPMITFSMGSLGYMCEFNFDPKTLPDLLNNILGSDADINLDERLRLKANVSGDPERLIFKGSSHDWMDPNKGQLTRIEDYHILNDVVIDRGPCPSSVQLELYLDGNFLTNCLGDGLIISTPTGSTAYNMSAGGSIVMTNTECICITPLAPHSLSFRPLIVPQSTKITVKKPNDNRNSAWVSLDGGFRFELKDGDALDIQGSSSKMSLVTEKTDNMVD